MAARQDWKLLSARTGIESSEPFAVIAPGASAPNRIWPPERWLAVMHTLEAEGLPVVILSGPQDVAVARQLHALGGGRATLLAGSTSLLESLSVVAHATIFLGNDSGPGHMAGALGVPSVILFSTGEGTHIDGPSMPERIRPAGPGVRVVRPSRPAPPCTNLCECGTPHCILGVSTAQVLEAVRLVLEKR
jgi:ADP-heptose:LPS heptosyltransferase